MKCIVDLEGIESEDDAPDTSYYQWVTFFLLFQGTYFLHLSHLWYQIGALLSIVQYSLDKMLPDIWHQFCAFSFHMLFCIALCGSFKNFKHAIECQTIFSNYNSGFLSNHCTVGRVFFSQNFCDHCYSFLAEMGRIPCCGRPESSSSIIW